MIETATVETAAPSCYRVSVLSGSLEVSARLKSAHDLELLMRVLEANKVLFTKANRLEPENSAKMDRLATEASARQSAEVKVTPPTTKTSVKANGSAHKPLAEVEQSESEILTLT